MTNNVSPAVLSRHTTTIHPPRQQLSPDGLSASWVSVGENISNEVGGVKDVFPLFLAMRRHRRACAQERMYLTGHVENGVCRGLLFY
jgi:hypothetical protein